MGGAGLAACGETRLTGEAGNIFNGLERVPLSPKFIFLSLVMKSLFEFLPVSDRK